MKDINSKKQATFHPHACTHQFNGCFSSEFWMPVFLRGDWCKKILWPDATPVNITIWTSTFFHPLG